MVQGQAGMIYLVTQIIMHHISSTSYGMNISRELVDILVITGFGIDSKSRRMILTLSSKYVDIFLAVRSVGGGKQSTVPRFNNELIVYHNLRGLFP